MWPIYIQLHRLILNTHSKAHSESQQSFTDRPTDRMSCIDVKTFFYVFYFGHVFTFLTFFIFQTFFILKKTLAKFTAASRLTRSTFKIPATK